MRHLPRMSHGFTLIELLVAIAALALLATISWRSIDAMSLSLTRTEAHSDEVLSLQMGLDQWETDLDALVQQPDLPTLDWDGRVLRMVRGKIPGTDQNLHVVAWTLQTQSARSVWLRWQSPALSRRGDFFAAWQQAAQWANNPTTSASPLQVSIAPLRSWQVLYYRGGTWAPPLQQVTRPPAAVRLVIDLPADAALAGQITKDWVSPQLSRSP
jgi:general secretion pathway protein J